MIKDTMVDLSAHGHESREDMTTTMANAPRNAQKRAHCRRSNRKMVVKK
jgi:hypothetical protein